MRTLRYKFRIEANDWVKKGQYSNEMGIAPLSISPPRTLHTMGTIECQRLVKEETIYPYLFTQTDECRQHLAHRNVTLCSCSKRPQRLEDCRTVSPWLFLGAGLMSVLAQQRTGLGRMQRLERGPILYNTCTGGAEAPGNRRSLRLYMEALVCSEWNKKPACNTQHISQLPVNPRKEKREAQCHYGQLDGCKFQQCCSTNDNRKLWQNIATIENGTLFFHTSRCEQQTSAKVHLLFIQKAKGKSGYGKSWPWGFSKSERHHYKCAKCFDSVLCGEKKNSLGIFPWKWVKPLSFWFTMLWLHLRMVSLTSGSRQASGSPTIGTRRDNECMCMEMFVHLELFSHTHWLIIWSASRSTTHILLWPADALNENQHPLDTENKWPDTSGQSERGFSSFPLAGTI